MYINDQIDLNWIESFFIFIGNILYGCGLFSSMSPMMMTIIILIPDVYPNTILSIGLALGKAFAVLANELINY